MDIPAPNPHVTVCMQWPACNFSLAACLLPAAALERSGVDPAAVDEVLMGNVCSANVGQVRHVQHSAAQPGWLKQAVCCVPRHSHTPVLTWC